MWSCSKLLDRTLDGGLRAEARDAYRQCGVVHIVDFQVASYSEDGSSTFTINLGVALEEVWRLYFGHGFSPSMGASYCFPSFRIGEAMGGFSGKSRDVWWTVVESEVQADLDVAVKSALH